MPGRSRDQIVASMLEVLNPAASERAAVARMVRRCVETIRFVATHWPSSPEERRASTRELQRYRTRLLAAQRKRPDWVVLVQPAALETELDRVQRLIRRRPRDVIAEAAMQLPYFHLLAPQQHTLTREGKWHRLSALLYEAGTGSDAHADKVLKYMREMKQGTRFRRPLLAGL
jgi:hypothetical protein